jgi:hypothetical protein
LAVPPVSNETFLREVDEELRRDQLLTFWQRYGRWLIAAILLGLALFGAYLYWQHRQEVKAGEDGEKLQKAYASLGANRPAEANKPLDELATGSTPGYRALAQFTQADVLLQRNDLKGAAAKFAAIAGNEDFAPAFRDLALIRQTMAEYDTLQPQQVIDRLRPMTAPGHPYLGSAGEMVAAAHLRAGRRDLAGRLFGQVAQDENVPGSIRQRAVQMAGLLGVDAIQQK